MKLVSILFVIDSELKFGFCFFAETSNMLRRNYIYHEWLRANEPNLTHKFLLEMAQPPILLKFESVCLVQRLEASHRSELGHLPLRVTNDHNDPRLFALAVDVLGVVSSASWLRKDQYADSNKVSKGDFFFMILPAW